MKGIYVVECMFDYCTQIAAFPTEAEAVRFAEKWREKTCCKVWVEFYKWGQEFSCD